MDAALRVLHVLTERAERAEVRPAPAPRARAAVDLLGVRGAAQVRVEVRELPVRPVARVALVREPIPRALRRPLARDRRRPGGGGPADHPVRVRDDVARVDLADQVVDHLARHARGARPGLEMQDERGRRREGTRAALHRARDGAPLVHGRVLVLAEVVRVLEHALAGHAVPICVALATMLVETELIAEGLCTRM